jgi:two-component system, OmpR family, phosphate regulon sensor histidine kinase PhoR
MAGRPADGDPKLRGLLEGLTEPALIVRDGLVLMANSPARSILGDGIEGQDVRLAIRHPAAVERLLAPAAGRAEEAALVGVGEADRRWMMNVARLEDGSLFVRLNDRSEAHAAEQMRVDFVANASHELRTPLATLVGYAETLREQGADLDAPTRERFTIIVHDEARRMQRLVEDLISLSRIEAERYSTPQDLLSLEPLIEAAREACRGFAEERNCEVRIDAEPGLPAITGDRSQILQMIDNLIGNALRYGRNGAPVSIGAHRERDMVHLAVSDEGQGIAAEHIPRLTERFYRADPSRSRSLGGTGLGLAIVKHIVERHRGRLSIESEIGRGTTVHVLLPIASSPGP